ncbi:MAG: hypothetical protein V9G19_26415 [Tetrasphaera sp.]
MSEIGYLLESGSNRFGALDFQMSPTVYVDRSDTATLDELHDAAARLQQGKQLSPVAEAALIHGTSIGGARPKVLVEDAGCRGPACFRSDRLQHGDQQP